MSHFGTIDFSLEAALGNVEGYGTIRKFGRATDCDSGDPTDIWDGADGVTGTKIWVPPTQARLHNIASTSANDTAAGTGARTMRIFGLTSWSTDEVSEDITLNGTTNVPTVNSYVIIYRKKCLTFGSGATNAGIITATAQSDNTVTAAILVGTLHQGQTLMAIFAIPSTKRLAFKGLQLDALEVPSGASIGVQLLVNERPDQSDSGFLVKGLAHLTDVQGKTLLLDPPAVYDGPALVKVQVESDTNNVSVSAAFDAYVVDA